MVASWASSLAVRRLAAASISLAAARPAVAPPRAPTATGWPSAVATPFAIPFTSSRISVSSARSAVASVARAWAARSCDTSTSLACASSTTDARVRSASPLALGRLGAAVEGGELRLHLARLLLQHL